jgi:hypothetical protein
MKCAVGDLAIASEASFINLEAKMRNDKLLKIVNSALFLALLTQAVTGLGMAFFEWDSVLEVHEVVGMILVLLVAIHLYLNRWWLKLAFKKRK